MNKSSIILLLLLVAVQIQLPTHAAQLKAIQSGGATIITGSSSTTVPITAVDPSKTFLVFSTRTNVDDPVDTQVSGNFSTGRNDELTFARDGTGASARVRWYLVEFVSGVSVQRGSVNLTGTTTTVNISAVDLTKSFPLISYREPGTNWGGKDFVRGSLPSTTQLQLDLAAAPTPPAVVEWQVVEYADAVVHAHDVTMASNQSLLPVTPGYPIDPSKTWLIYSYTTGDSGTKISRHMVRGFFNGGGGFSFDRYVTGVEVSISAFVVEFTDVTTVQQGTASWAVGPPLNLPVSIPIGVDLARSIAVGGYLNKGGKTNLDEDDSGISTAWAEMILTGSNSMIVYRGRADEAAQIEWSVLEFSAPVPISTISGKVFEDADFAGTASGYDEGAGDQALAGVDVELYDGGTDAYITSTTTAGDGSYSFGGLTDGSYKVRVRSATIGSGGATPKGGLNASVPLTWPNPLAEMTWANGAAAYGGQSPTVDDTVTGDNGGPGDTYLSVGVSGADVSGVDFGFAYNLIVNTDDDLEADVDRSKQGSLRQFIKNANAIGSAGGTTANSSQFRIPGAGVQTIQPGPVLPSIVEPLILDGYTQPGSKANTVPAPGTTDAVLLIELDGTNAAPGVWGLALNGGNTTVRGLVINRFGSHGILIQGQGGNTVEGNYIGTDTTGSLDQGNGGRGILLSFSGNHTVGGIDPGARNVISGNTSIGVGSLGATSSNHVIRGNYIGVNAAGTAKLGNGSQGVYLTGSGSVVGGAVAGAANLIGGNALHGLLITSSSATGNEIQGNVIGTDWNGTSTFDNAIGVHLGSGASGNLVGGTETGEGNTIAFNRMRGIVPQFDAGTGNSFLGNEIRDNGGLGIDLGNNNVTPNDEGDVDGDPGPNDYLNFPVITSAMEETGTVTVDFDLDVKVGWHRIEFFRNTAADPSGYGEGETFIDFVNVDHPGGGSQSFSHSFAGSAGDILTATTTECTDDPTCDAFGSTSEFSAAVTAQLPSEITGRVFEDVNYGGGAGRDFAAATTSAPSFSVGRPGAVVEFYAADGSYLNTTITGADGSYGFSGLSSGDYQVRVVNESADSSRPGATPNEWPVQTYRTDASSGLAVGVTGEVGGAMPPAQDSPANGGGVNLSMITAQSVAPVSVAAGVVVADVDFGFNFDTIVNTNESGQGSLRQFLENSNQLTNADLAQEDLPPGVETSLFMVPSNLDPFGRPADPNFDAGRGVAVFTVTSLLPPIIDDSTAIDGATQTEGVDDTNLVILGTGGTVGVEGLALPQVAGPEIEIVAGAMLTAGIDIQANAAEIRGIAAYGFGTANNNGTIRIGADDSTNFTGTRIEGNVLGTSATSFTDPDLAVPGSGTVGCSVIALGADDGTLQNNLIGFAGRLGATLNTGADDWVVAGNEFRRNGLDAARLDGLSLSGGSTRGVVTGNLFVDNQGAAVDFFASPGSHTVRNNTLEQNGWGLLEPGGIRMFGSGSTIDRNVIRDNIGTGVLAVVEDLAFTQTPATHNRITRNHFSGNSSNAIDLQTTLDVIAPGDGITLNDGTLLGDGSIPNVCGTAAAHGNEGLDFPVIDVASISGGTATVQGRACPGSDVEIYRAAADGDGSDTLSGTDYGEGLHYLGTTTADGVTGEFTLGGIAGLSAGDAVSAIAIDGSGNTSEFGPSVTVGTGIAGRVFEDVNYGGGAGRDQTTSSGVGRENARVELYDGTGTFADSTTTDVDGLYLFPGLAAGDYTVRVVSSSVTSSRTGYLAGMLPVQTYRTDASSGSVVAVIDHVGGEDPGKADAGDGGAGTSLVSLTTATTTAQSLTAVAVTGVDTQGVDFGFNFDTIVNNNDTGQGSLRQFIENANGLANGGLAQVGRPADVENAIFMLADGTARPGMHVGYASRFTGGVATVAPGAAFPIVDDPVVLDASTQPGYSGSPLIELDGSGAGAGTSGFRISAGASTVRGFVIHSYLHTGIRTDTAGGNTITANWLGTDATGAAAAPNQQQGLLIWDVPNNVVGGTDPADRNVISGNRLRGILMEGEAATGNRIEGNFIGTDVSGTAAVPNDIGIYLTRAPGNWIGGTDADAGNVLSGNDIFGLYLVFAETTGNFVQQNTIGLNADRTAPLGNGSSGISVWEASGNTIGGVVANAANVISGNQTGIALSSGNHNSIRANSIYANTGLGIDINNDSAVSPNDGTFAAGANDEIDYPVFTSVVLVPGSLSVAGHVGSAPDQSAFAGAVIDLFESDNSPADQDGEVISGDGLSVPHGEGGTYLGSLTADGSGNFSGTLGVSGLTAGEVITSTATDAAGNTSEFGANEATASPQIVKLAFDANGTRIPAGTVVARGARVKFLLYVDNPGGPVDDVGLQDALDPAFAYVAGSIRYDNSMASCAAAVCSVAEEAAIFTAVDAGTVGSDDVDGDVVSFSAGIVDAGNQTQANAQLNILGARVWAMLITVKMQ